MGTAELTARAGYAFLTGVLRAVARDNPELKNFIFQALIKCHSENPVYNSSESIEEWKKEVANEYV